MLRGVPLHRLTSGGAILCFHSLTSPDRPASGDAHLSFDQFAACIRSARRWGEFVPLSDLVTRHLRGRSTSGLLAATFDDGYEALCGELKRFVQREGLPIAIFVVTGAAQTGARYWWDRIDDVFRRTSTKRWRAFEDAVGVSEAFRQGQPREYGPLRPLRQWILATYAGRWPPSLEAEINILEREAGYTTCHRAMTFAELTELATMAEVEIGVHTVSHPVLPLLCDTELQGEIADSYRTLRTCVGSATLPVLAVPFGLYDERTLHFAAAAGMVASLTLSGGTLGATPFHATAIPRICITRLDSRAKLGVRLLGLPQRIRAWRGHRGEPYPALPSATT
jgi:peptidoglycan/xylan/chitin deacetylase (PgdA/CDA1 family)